MNAKQFTDELNEALQAFLTEAEKHGYYGDPTWYDDVDIEFGRGYITLRTEIENDDDTVTVCTQELEIHTTDECCSLCPLYFEVSQD